jgi:hypothetical protein
MRPTPARRLDHLECSRACGRPRLARPRARSRRRQSLIPTCAAVCSLVMLTIVHPDSRGRALARDVDDCRSRRARLTISTAREGQEALRTSAATARALETVKTPRGRRPQARERSIRSSEKMSSPRDSQRRALRPEVTKLVLEVLPRANSDQPDDVVLAGPLGGVVVFRGLWRRGDITKAPTLCGGCPEMTVDPDSRSRSRRRRPLIPGFRASVASARALEMVKTP